MEFISKILKKTFFKVLFSLTFSIIFYIILFITGFTKIYLQSEALISIVLIFAIFTGYIYRKIDIYFQKVNYIKNFDKIENLDIFFETIWNTKTLEEAIIKTKNFLKYKMNIKKIYFFMLDTKTKEYYEINKIVNIVFEPKSPLIEYLKTSNGITRCYELNKILFGHMPVLYLLNEQLEIHLLYPFKQQGKLLGFMSLTYNDYTLLSKNVIKYEELLLQKIAREISTSIFYFKMLEKRYDELAKFTSKAYPIFQAQNYDELFESFSKLLYERLKIDIFTIWIYNQTNNILELKYTYGLTQKAYETGYLKIGESITGHIFSKQIPLFIKDISQNNYFLRISKERYFQKSLISVPITKKDIKLGVINVYRGKTNKIFKAEDILLVKIIAGMLFDRISTFINQT